jgi:hypothetical protein
MSRASAMARGRLFAETGMTDHCVVTRTKTSSDVDPATGQAASITDTVYAGRCEFIAADTEARDITSAGRPVTQQGAVLKVPVDSDGSASITAGDAFVATLTQNGLEPIVVRGRVGGGHHQTAAVSRRIPVEVTSSG